MSIKSFVDSVEKLPFNALLIGSIIQKNSVELKKLGNMIKKQIGKIINIGINFKIDLLVLKKKMLKKTPITINAVLPDKNALTATMENKTKFLQYIKIELAL
ncbi:hypothetical protein [Limnobaculum xujianqingii]|uniref:hypothetical protein n=1 Tax=Limnobaculum xujianqingii TaxID=2738837 RepID=UPI001E54C45A|nr:hypothetical protein [Limnobaculum xujianqingii]